MSCIARTVAVTRDQGVVAWDEPTRSWNLRLDISRIATISKGFNWLILDAIFGTFNYYIYTKMGEIELRLLSLSFEVSVSDVSKC